VAPVPKQYLKPETAGMNASSSMHCMVSPIAVAFLDQVSRPSHKPYPILSLCLSSGFSRNASCKPSQNVSFIAS
jgi:hypothetical protein